MTALRAEDFRLAFRRLRKSLGTTLASALALAFGIGAAAATWSLISSVLLEPLPVRDPERLFLVEPPQALALPGGMRLAPHLSYRDFETISTSGAFDGLAAGGAAYSLLVAEQGEIPVRRNVDFVNRDYFGTLGVDIALGRAFAPEEDRRGAAPVALLSHGYWRSAFGEDPDVLGRTIRVAESTVTIVGVLPRGFRGLSLATATDIYLPLHTIDDIGVDPFFAYLGQDLPGRGTGIAWIRVVGRLRDGESATVAAARLNASFEDGRMLTLRDVNTAAIPETARSSMTHFTTLLSITVGLLVLIGSLTVGMLLLVRTEDRRDELSVRLALGASRTRLATGIGAEAAILSVLGAVLAIPVTSVLYSGVRAFQLPGGIDVSLLELSFDAQAWLVIAGAAMIATWSIALLASLFGLTGHNSAPLHARTMTTPRTRRRALRTALVAGQVAITLVLVAGAGLFTRSLTAALSLNAHLGSDRIVTADVTLAPHGYTPERAVPFFEELRNRLQASAAVESVSIYQSTGGTVGQVTIDGVPHQMPSILRYMEVDDAYFSTFGLPIVGGRGFTRADASDSPLVVIVSESFGRLIAGDESPVGHVVTETRRRAGEEAVVAEVVGVVPDVVLDVDTTAPLAMYYPLAQRDRTANARVVIRAAGNADAAIPEITAAVRAIDPRVTLTQVLTLEEQIGRQMNPQRFGMFLLGTLGGIALLLTVLGTYVVATSLVVGRRREMSIRAALGARGTQLGAIVLGDTARLVGIGLAAGIVLALLGAKTIRALLYQVAPLDPKVLATTAGVILGLALLVSLRPALEAMRLDLTRSLRED